jgi:GNAT superfamily N-acetyltransferase
MFTVHRASTGADWREATALLYDYVEWVRGWTGIDPLAEEPQLHTEMVHLADHYVTDDSALYLAAWETTAAGAVAIRLQPDGDAELKRMYVRPFARRRGVADRLIDAAVAGATERQCRTAWLQTLRGPMDPAIAVYRRNGFAESSTRRPTLSMEGAIAMERILDWPATPSAPGRAGGASREGDPSCCSPRSGIGSCVNGGAASTPG